LKVALYMFVKNFLLFVSSDSVSKRMSHRGG